MEQGFAERFAREWIEAWNAHDLERVLAHYADDFVIASPLVARIAGAPGGRLRGKPAIRAYWRKALDAAPGLHFELREVYAGVDSVTLTYVGHRGLVAEVFRFGADGRVLDTAVHYQE